MPVSSAKLIYFNQIPFFNNERLLAFIMLLNEVEDLWFEFCPVIILLLCDRYVIFAIKYSNDDLDAEDFSRER